jgi:hypothetical protein
MPISDLQIGLIALGATGVIGVFAYNKWQERKHRAHADRVFRQDHPDVLIEPPGGPAAPTPTAVRQDTDEAPVERIEPVIGDAPAEEPTVADDAHAMLPEIDPRIDCIVRFEAAEPVAGNEFWSAQRHAFELIDKPIRWFALEAPHAAWRELDAHSAGRFQQFCCALQIADRRGPLSGGEMVSFFEGLQMLGDRFLAVVDYPQRETVLSDANAVDAFCAGVDAQIAVHVVASQSPFAGTKLRGIVEAAGLQLRGDGQFHAEDGEGRTLFTIGNLEAALFAAEELANLQTHGVTLTVDVPRVAQGVNAFDRMIALALRLAQSLGGEIVDDNRAKLSEPALLKIRQTVEQFQEQMVQQGVPAGSATALRLFS